MISQAQYDNARTEFREGGAKPEGDNHQIKYRVINDTAYHFGTPLTVINVLEELQKNERVVRVMTGYTNHYWHLQEEDRPRVGEIWLEESDVIGRIGRSTGRLKVPLLVPVDDDGGPALSDDLILRISNRDNVVLYEAPDIRWPKLTVVEDELVSEQPGYSVVYRYRVDHAGKEQARFRTKKGADAYVRFFSPDCGIKPSTVKEPRSVVELAADLMDEYGPLLERDRSSVGETLAQYLDELRSAFKEKRFQKA